MEKIKEMVTGKPSEQRHAERAAEGREGGVGAGAGAAGLGTTAERGTYGEQAAYGEGGTEYTGGVAGGPAYGTAATGYTEKVPVVQQTTTTAAVPAAGVETRQAGEAAVCAQEYFTKTEDRPVVKERVELIQEHRPVEKEFVVETRATGVEREVGTGEVEHLGTTERIVSVTPPSAPCE